MSSAAPSSGGSIICDNCHQTLPASSDRCLYCGVVLRGSGPVGGAAGAPLVADVPEELRRLPVASVMADDGKQRERAIAERAGAVAGPTTSEALLGPKFAGTPAGVAQRIAALTIDVAAIILVVATVTLIFRSAVLTAVAAVEVLAILTVLQARAGLGLGTAILGLRVARADAPFSPGTWRSLVRGLVLAAGAAVALVGVWVVEASATWNARRRSWADRAAGTVVVAVPARSERASRGVSRTVDLSPPVVQADAAVQRPGIAAGAAGARRDDVDQHDVDQHDVDQHDVDQHDVDQHDVDQLVGADVGAGERSTVELADAASLVVDRANEAPPAMIEPDLRTGRSPPSAPAAASEFAPGPPVEPVTSLGLPATPAPTSAAPPAPAVDPGVVSAPAVGPRRSRSSAAAQVQRQKPAQASPVPSAPPASSPPPPSSPSSDPDVPAPEQIRPPGPRRSRSASPVVPTPSEEAAEPIVPPPASPPVAFSPAPPPPEDPGTLMLVFDTGQRAVHSIPVAINLGRNPVADEATDVLIRVDDHESSVSRTHARLETDGVHTWVTDNGSTNGTDLIDESGRATALLPGVRTIVEDGDRVRVGNRVFTVGRLVEERA